MDALERLFAIWNEEPGRKLDIWVQETEDIPLHWLAFAIGGVLQSHLWNSLPLPAEIRKAAHYAAGMHRERYHAGKYLPPSTDWPARGKRYAITSGEFELLKTNMAIGPGEIAPRLSTGADDGG
jgi:hypothetical protein